MADHVPAPRLIARLVRYHNRIFWRTPIAAFFTLVFPLMFLVLFNVLFGVSVEAGPTRISVAQFFAPSLAVFAAASATYTNLGIGTAIARDQGVLKRIRGTPTPPWAYLSGRVGSAMWIALLATVLMMAVGTLAYDVTVDVERLPAALLTFAVGVAAFAALGLALAALSPSGDTAPAIANATLLPLAFISGVFIPIEDPPRWLDVLATVFPLKHFVVAFQDAFSPFTTDLAFRWGNLAVMAVWGVVGAAVALATFRWEPRGGERARLTRRRAGAGAGVGVGVGE
ncbi:MAG: ABC transporter permease [Actinomycetota bacterium]|nr:ABC transporter permease [Actinomycetota bacterium]